MVAILQSLKNLCSQHRCFQKGNKKVLFLSVQCGFETGITAYLFPLTVYSEVGMFRQKGCCEGSSCTSQALENPRNHKEALSVSLWQTFLAFQVQISVLTCFIIFSFIFMHPRKLVMIFCRNIKLFNDFQENRSMFSYIVSYYQSQNQTTGFIN